MAYSLPYILILSIFAVCACLFELTSQEDKKKYIVFLSIVFFFFFFAFRGYVYSDWTSYAAFLDEVEWGDLFMLTNKYQKAVIHEPGFTLLCLLCKSVINEYAFLVFVITSIDLVLFLRFLRRFNISNVPFVFMMFLAFSGPGLMFNLMRNQIAIFIFLNALEYLVDRKPLPYFLLCALALCFHLSSLFFFPLYFIFHRNLNRWVFGGLFLFFFVFYISGVSIVQTMLAIFGIDGSLGEKISFYTENLTRSRALSLTGTLEKLALVTLIFCYYDKIRAKGHQIFLNALLAHFFFYYIFAEFVDLSQRLATLFVFPYWVITYDLYSCFKVINNKLVYSIVFFLYLLYMTMSNYTKPIQEYDNLLLGGKTQEERLRIFNRTFEEDN